jgi:hypothetical protein
MNMIGMKTKPSTSLQREMLEHVLTLLVDNEIAVNWVYQIDDCEAYSTEDSPVVEICRPFNRSKYLLALHQLGHHLAIGSENIYLDEVEAWRWAFKESRVAISPVSFRVVEKSIMALIRDYRYTHIRDEFISLLRTEAKIK